VNSLPGAGKVVGSLCMLVLLSGCGRVRQTLPARSAMEQFLISTAADRAVERIPAAQQKGRKVFVDVSSLECYDKPYVTQRIRQAVLHGGGSLADSAEGAEVLLQVASGGLSINERNYLLGIPELPLPIPFAGEYLRLPELPIFKVIFFRGRAKLLFNAVDPASGEQLYQIPAAYGKSMNSYWWILFLGPFEWTDLPKGAQ